MKFSESWLREFVNPAISGEAFSHALTMAGLEVEEASFFAPPFSGVIVAEVLSVTKHPDADKLNVCRVNIGSEEVQIVCGAPNVAAGIKVPCALPGALLPNDFKIKVAKVRGVESSGMLCSAKELGISEESSGLLILENSAKIGQNLRDFLDCDDTIRLLKLTPNRADCLSLQGLAREVSAILELPLQAPKINAVNIAGDKTRQIKLNAKNACPRYVGRIISNVNAKAPTPNWLKNRLERSGIRAISSLVDITNYVMLEQGQPLHAFDNAKLSGDICVRFAKNGEKIKLLNEQVLELTDDVLLIADDKNPLAMAGIMGGADSAISLETTELFLESAFFAPKAIAGRARRYSFVSDASHRFERGVDFSGCEEALERASQLVLEICGGQANPIIHASHPEDLPARKKVTLRPARLQKVLGVAFSEKQISEIFTRLNFSFTQHNGDFIVAAPSYRFDIEIEEDLIEEIARLFGYENIPVRAPIAQMPMLPATESTKTNQKIRQMLVHHGFNEVINFAFVDEAWETDFANNAKPIRLANPIANNMNVMRSNLIGGLIANVQTNLKRKQERVRLFEIGRCFSQNGNVNTDENPIAGFDQAWKIAAISYGTAEPENWGNTPRAVDFYDMKGLVETLLNRANCRFEKLNHPAFHPGRAASVLVDQKIVGFVGELHPKWQQKYDLPTAPVIFELDLDTVKTAHFPNVREISSQPQVIRDLAFVVDQTHSLQSILEGLKAHANPLITDISLFDVYSGKGVPEGKKSLAFRIVMQDTSRTLQEAEVKESYQKLVDFIEQKLGALLRT